MKLKEMLVLQDRLNCVVNPNWQTAGYNWCRAIMHEAVECQEHVGWKWWKKQTPDIAQAQIEMVDIWHFILSHFIVRCEGSLDYAEQLLAGRLNMSHVCAGRSLLEKLDLLVEAAAQGRADVPLFASILIDLGLPLEHLERIYIAKNVLNMFRQANGYKQGTYVKTWGGVEDNVVLERIMSSVPDATPDDLYSYLTRDYAAVLSSRGST